MEFLGFFLKRTRQKRVELCLGQTKICCVSGNDLKNFWVGRSENDFIL